MDKTEQSNKSWWKVVAILGVAVVFELIVLILSSERETKTSEPQAETAVSALYCKSAVPVEPFFDSRSASEALHEIKVTFNKGVPDKFSYTYSGVYGSESEADQMRSRFHADYNIYLGTNNVNQESLYPTFTFDGAKAKINLFGVGEESLNSVTARFFFLSADVVRELETYSSDELMKIYADRGFSCTDEI